MMKRRLAFFAIATAALPEVAIASPIDLTDSATTQEPDRSIVGDFPAIVSDDVLAEQRGGFVINGMTVRLGADVRTYIDGQLALHTIINWTDTGVTKTQTVGAQLTPAQALSFDANALANGKINMALGGSPAFSANEGQTMIAHRFQDGLQNILINAASNQNILQTVDASVELGGYDAFRINILNASMADALSASIGQMSFQ
jgi:hypothetical protein